MKRSPWFNARTQPPVNGGEGAWYENRCTAPDSSGDVVINPKRLIKTLGDICRYCQWRGLLREDDVLHKRTHK